ncbi:uncharacterized protein LOC121390025 [Gigantopelta aegis]|uniref:uncharacterized protein LOC121390025 n=1 Tax=Gigantopelta aegis TaxID=1735272 RepID=UPI001B88BDB7|nr:uncharacterized protein LOC121390025 [Gigantopelta aegis]
MIFQTKLVCVFGVVLTVCLPNVDTVILSNIDSVIKELYKKTAELQEKKDSKYIPPEHWKKDKGVYGSEVKVNTHGPPELAFIRHAIAVFDNNMFVTSWITIALMEAHLYGMAPKPSSEQIVLALDSISSYHDKNRHYNSSIMNFWPQRYNESVDFWQSSPENLYHVLDIIRSLPIKDLEKLLDWLGLKDVEKLLKDLIQMIDSASKAFRIPPDFDDSFLNLGLGSLLLEMKAYFPSELSLWKESNTNVTSVFDALKKYAYRPFSTNKNINTIDPRTYFYIRHFLVNAKEKSQDVALVSTWIQDIEEEMKIYKKGVAMPFGINNVDVTVAANFMYGVTSSVLSGLQSLSILDDKQIQQIFLNTTSLIAYEIKADFIGRRDLALTYYPSVLEFYFFVARTYALLERTAKYSKLPHPALVEVMSILAPVLKGKATHVILDQAKPLGDDMVFFDDFLGDGDCTRDNKTLIRAEDRIFTTAMAVNCLIRTWTVFDDMTRKLVWMKETPSKVIETASKATKWLTVFTLSGDYKPWNTFFSGSSKGFDTLPFWYPINRLQYLNGTVIHDHVHFPQGLFMLGVEGVIPEAKYEAMFNQPHFGVKTPTKFHGYNTGSGFFPFWSSDAYTYSVTMLALAQFENTVQQS